jgi:5'-nucleotidase (lipoprotein e(P4) family)
MRVGMLTIISFLSLDIVAQAQNMSITDSLSQSATSVKEYPVLWQQTAAEYRALCYQAFNIAEMRLKNLESAKSKLPMAIITDLDETILDNSYMEAQLIKEGKDYRDAAWKKWTERSMARAVPGADQFLRKASKKGLVIFYVSNRDTGEIKSTLLNLKKLNLPNADEAHMLFMSNTSSKEIRRQMIMANYNVVMLLGDNLNDFTQYFEKKPITERLSEVDKVKDDWGDKFIVLPNSTYGEWENAIYEYKHQLTPTQKETMRRQKLIGY